MRIVRAVFTPKKKSTSKNGIKMESINGEKEEFEVPLMEESSRPIVKRSRDINLIESKAKKQVKQYAIPPVKEIFVPKLAKFKTKIDSKPESKKFVRRPQTKTEGCTKSSEKATINSKPVELNPEFNSKSTIDTKTEVEKIENAVNKPFDNPIASVSSASRRSSRLSSPYKTDLKITKVTASAFETLRRSKRPVAAKVDRKSLMIESSDEGAADESFEISEISEEADEMEMIEISEGDEAEETEEFSETEHEIKKKIKKETKKNKKTISSKRKRPIIKKKDASRWERIKKVLESGGTVEALPGRIDEFDWIKRTVTGLLESSLGGCLYISGVPGTGKTATTHRTLDSLSLAALKGECCDFDFVEINGMRLSDPGQAYSILAKTIFRGQKRIPTSGALSLQKLEAHFKAQQKLKTPGRPCIVLLDELDLLLRKKQSILYHFFEWPNWANSQLIVITIANTMDLPERFLSNRISSRLGLTRYNFKPYDHAALANIIEHQLKDYVQYLGKDAIQLCARKVSAVSGDARRAVNFAKRAVDYFRSCTQEELLARMTGRVVEKVAEGSEMTAVNLRLMDIILKDALMANPVEVISQLSKHQRILLLSIVLARKRCEEESSLKGGTKIIGASKTSAVLTINRVLDQHFQLCRTHQYHPLPSLQELYCLLESLESLRLLRCVKFRESGPEGVVQLLVHEEDIRKGLGDDQALKKYIRD